LTLIVRIYQPDCSFFNILKRESCVFWAIFALWLERMIFEESFKKIMAAKSTSSNPTTVLIIILLVLTFPLWLGIAGALFGVIIGIFGAAIGLIAGIFGAVFGAIGGLFGWMFNWGWPFGGLFHWNVIPILIIIVGVLLISHSRRR
jgi:hypothetical protein